MRHADTQTRRFATEPLPHPYSADFPPPAKSQDESRWEGSSPPPLSEYSDFASLSPEEQAAARFGLGYDATGDEGAAVLARDRYFNVKT